MLNQGIATIQNNQAGASPITQRFGGDGDAIVSELHGRYFRETRDGRGFFISSQAVATTTVGLATTYTGLVLSNPINSNVVVELNKCTMMQSVIQGTQVEAYALAVGFNASTNVTHTAGVTPQSTLVGSGLASIANADTSATLPTAPKYYSFIQNTATATANGPDGLIDLEGSLILLPGAYIAWVTPAQASVAGMWFSFQWIETPLITG